MKIALAHVQLETIHPFRDGNGRIGRLLISLLLCSQGMLAEPLLYASVHLKLHRREYYDRLQAVRRDGDWEGWLQFFLEGLVASAEQALATAREVLALFERNRRELSRSSSALRVFDQLQKRPISSVRELEKASGLTYPTVLAALDQMRKARFVTELTGRRRNRLFSYAPYLAILSTDAEPFSSNRHRVGAK